MILVAVVIYRDPQCCQEPATTCETCGCLSETVSLMVMARCAGNNDRRDSELIITITNIPLLAALTTVLHVLVGEADTWSRHRQLAMPK